jgi:hypothetical protein
MSIQTLRNADDMPPGQDIIGKKSLERTHISGTGLLVLGLGLQVLVPRAQVSRRMSHFPALSGQSVAKLIHRVLTSPFPQSLFLLLRTPGRSPFRTDEGSAGQAQKGLSHTPQYGQVHLRSLARTEQKAMEGRTLWWTRWRGARGRKTNGMNSQASCRLPFCSSS